MSHSSQHDEIRGIISKNSNADRFFKKQAEFDSPHKELHKLAKQIKKRIAVIDERMELTDIKENKIQYGGQKKAFSEVLFRINKIINPMGFIVAMVLILGSCTIFEKPKPAYVPPKPIIRSTDDYSKYGTFVGLYQSAFYENTPFKSRCILVFKSDTGNVFTEIQVTPGVYQYYDDLRLYQKQEADIRKEMMKKEKNVWAEIAKQAAQRLDSTSYYQYDSIYYMEINGQKHPVCIPILRQKEGGPMK